VATVENRVYYVKNCSNDCFFYLDGWEARDLYNLTDPVQMVQYLRAQNVSFIVDVAWARDHGHFNVLPLAKYLGDPSPYFPTLFTKAGANPAIYNVGPIPTPLTNASIVTVSTNREGWSQLTTVNGVQTQSVIAGSDSPRLYVATPNATKVNITYLDSGTDSVTINLWDSNSSKWVIDYGVIQKTNTGTWKSFEFNLPIPNKWYVELGLHAYNENFTISRIDASPIEFAK
jgi:hypothetical protein